MSAPAVQRRRSFELLLVEDNPADVRLTEEALRESRIPYHLQVASDGVDALACLRREGDFSACCRPHLILLDWNLPRMDGREVLKLIKMDEQLRDIPVVVLTTSTAVSDIEHAYDLQANCFITKPVSVVRFFEVINALEHFWLETATLPAPKAARGVCHTGLKDRCGSPLLSSYWLGCAFPGKPAESPASGMCARCWMRSRCKRAI